MDDLAALTPPQYGTSMHYPACQVGACTGCLPPLPPPLDLTLFRPALNMPIATRPQDWEPVARAILRARGAWRT